jgi:N-methylhydantoinase B
MHATITISISGGMGGYYGGDGLSAIDNHGGHCAILSAEVMETMSPIRVLDTQLVPDSGGKGKWRGGLAITRRYEVLSDELILSGYMQQTRAETAAWGYDGGESGQPASVYLYPRNSKSKKLLSKFVGLRMKLGDVIQLSGSGGGGWGDPKDRDTSLIQADRRFSYLTDHEAN